MQSKSFSVEEYLNQGGTFFQQGEFKKAEAILKKAISSFPKNAEAYYNLGLIYSKQNLSQKSISSYKKALKLKPTLELAYHNIGVTYLLEDKIDEAEKTFKKLLTINPQYQPAIYNMGLVLERKGKFAEAINMFNKSANLNPDYLNAHLKIGFYLLNNGKAKGSIKYFTKALINDPKIALAQCGLGTALEMLGRLSQSKKALEKSLALDPNLPNAITPLFELYRKICDWKNAEIMEKKLDELTRKNLANGNVIAEPPYLNILRSNNPEFNLQVASQWSQMIEADIKHAKRTFTYPGNKKGKIKIGYLSNDFRNHPMAAQTVDLFKYHDKKKFEIFAYSYGPNDKSMWRREIEKNVDHFIDLHDVSHENIAEQINNDRIDILIDLVGNTGYQKPDIVARRPAPIQISYLGFPGTSGSKYIDYLIADKIVIPPSENKYFSEKIVYLPNCYQICSQHKISNKVYKRKDFKLPEDQSTIIFCSFNRAEKIEKHMFDAWVKILKKVPNSVLWLFSTHKLTEENLKKYIKGAGIEQKRLIFTSRLTLDKHLARLKLADIALDTQIYSGGATTANALWAGIPVISIYGDHYLSRMSSSIIKNIGLDELIANNLSEYEELAISLGNNPKHLKEIKSKLEINKSTYPLFNSPLFTKNIEKIYENIWKEHFIR